MKINTGGKEYYFVNHTQMIKILKITQCSKFVKTLLGCWGQLLRLTLRPYQTLKNGD